MHLSTLLPVPPLLFSATCAWHPKDRDCSDLSVCLTSFKWCEESGGGCHFPENVYPQQHYAGPFPALVWGTEYEVSWKVQDGNAPLTLQWRFSGVADRGNVGMRVQWETNITDSAMSYTFKPSHDMFPNPLSPNITFLEAQGLVYEQSTLVLFQGNISDPTTVDYSDTFIVFDGWVPNFIDYAVGQKENSERKKRAIGVGVGVGVSWFVAWLIASILTQHLQRRKCRKGQCPRDKGEQKDAQG